MPPPSHIEDFDPRFFRPCIFPVLGGLGYGVRPTINNGVVPGDKEATDLAVSLSLFEADGRHLGTSGELMRLAPGETAKLDFEELLDRDEVSNLIEHPGEGADALGVLHLVPAELDGSTSARVSTRSLMTHMLASDDFIEFYQRPAGVITGVAYQTGPKNDARFSSTMTTVVQAPKVIVSEPADTLFSLMNVSTSFDYDRPATLDFWILGPDGSRVARSAVTVPAWTYRLVSMTEVLEDAGKLDEFRDSGGLGMLLGYSKNGTVVPLSLTRNKRSGAIACDHTLPPVFYLSTWGGDARLAANARLEAEFFAEAPATEKVVAR